MNRRLALLSLILPLGGCALSGVRGSGVAATEVRPVAPFTRVAASRGVQLVVSRGETDGLTVTADDNLLSLLVAESDGEVLAVKFSEPVRTATPARVKVNAPTLTAVAAASGASVTVHDLEAGALTIGAASGAFVSASGFAETLKIAAASGSDVDAAGLAAGAVTVSAASGATAGVNAAESLTVKAASGAGVSYTVSPGVTPSVTTASGATAGPAR